MKTQPYLMTNACNVRSGQQDRSKQILSTRQHDNPEHRVNHSANLWNQTLSSVCGTCNLQRFSGLSTPHPSRTQRVFGEIQECWSRPLIPELKVTATQSGIQRENLPQNKNKTKSTIQTTQKETRERDDMSNTRSVLVLDYF